jgi:hypothetical protein
MLILYSKYTIYTRAINVLGYSLFEGKKNCVRGYQEETDIIPRREKGVSRAQKTQGVDLCSKLKKKLRQGISGRNRLYPLNPKL